jgi:ATP-dependent RNA helicase DeaD
VNQNSAAEPTAAVESSSVSAFAALNLNPAVLQALADVGYEVPTPIQAATIPPLLAGADLLGQAQTGTGKTAAFALPVLSKIDLGRAQPQALVLVPTRELAIQVAEAFQSYAAHMRGFHVLPIYGGQSYTPQIKGLKRGAHVVVGTPGRIMDHMKRGTLDLTGLSFLVLDEADEMLQMGFVDDIEWILEQTPATRQVVLFSATLPAAIRRIAQKHQRTPVEITIKSKTSTAANIRQRYWLVSGLHKLDALTRILEVETFDGMLIFVRTKLETVELSERLQARGFNAAALNGDIHQQQRERTVNALKSGEVDIVVATDVAARGLDVERVSHVVNYDVPYDSESYVHRIGRTGRAGRKGEAILFIAPRERNMLRIIERATRQPIEQMRLPSIADVNEQRVAKFKQRITEAVEAGEGEAYRQLVEQFETEQNIPAIEIAAALASLAQGGAPLLLPEKPEGWGGAEGAQRRGRGEGREDSRGDRRGERFEGRGERDGRRGDRFEPRGEAQPDRGERSAELEARGEPQADRGERSERLEARGEAQADRGERSERFEARGEAQADRGDGSERLEAHGEAQVESARFGADEGLSGSGGASSEFESREQRSGRRERGDQVEGAPAHERDDRFEGREAPRKKRGPNGISFETFRIEVGHVHGVKPGNIVGAIANEAGLEGRHIGHVDIHDDHSFVDLPEGMPKEIFRALKQVRVLGQELQITYANGKPNAGGKGRGRGSRADRAEHTGPADDPGQGSQEASVGEGEVAGAAGHVGFEGRDGQQGPDGGGEGHSGSEGRRGGPFEGRRGSEGRGERDERPQRHAGPGGGSGRDDRFGRKYPGGPGGSLRHESAGRPAREGGFGDRGGSAEHRGFKPRGDGPRSQSGPGSYSGGGSRSGPGSRAGSGSRSDFGGPAGRSGPRSYSGGGSRSDSGSHAGSGGRPGPRSHAGPKGPGGFKRHAGPKSPGGFKSHGGPKGKKFSKTPRD